MKLALMQPYFFPYVGYFDLINVCDKFIVFETAQYIKQGWINRNRVLHQESGWQYLVVPVERHPSASSIDQVRIIKDQSWKNKVLARLSHLKRQAPNYKPTIELVDYCLQTEERNIARFNVSVLEKICDFIGIKFQYRFMSELSIEFDENLAPGDWALQASQLLGADMYINLPGGQDLFDRGAFEKSEIKLEIRRIPELVYDTGTYEFEKRLSIIDVLMWNSVERIQDFLKSTSEVRYLPGKDD